MPVRVSLLVLSSIVEEPSKFYKEAHFTISVAIYDYSDRWLLSALETTHIGLWPEGYRLQLLDFFRCVGHVHIFNPPFLSSSLESCVSGFCS